MELCIFVHQADTDQDWRKWSVLNGLTHDSIPYKGFPCNTSSAVTKASGIGIPAISRAADAYARVADVTIAQHGLELSFPGSSFVR